ncbi:ABC transporter permease [Aeromicrobium sp. Leaf350]|uniref:ABC transporter permease n=1 Tax=Aeromicrobium sp. Leaf350 TaxID=2876565 RepID=UPI001E3CFA95|nr:ABC transporter permease [Aeromicrobium sp. Leaf350]
MVTTEPDAIAPAARPGLVPLTLVGGRPPLGTYLRQVWQRRSFIYALARFRIEAENHQNRLGMAWVVLKPLLNAGLYGTIFGVLMASGRPPHFVEFLVIGVFLFEFFATSFTSGAKSITTNTALVQSLAFPRMALPIAVVLQRLLQFVPMLAIMVVVVAAFGHPIGPEWLLLVPLTVLFFAFNTGLALIAARLTVHVRDLNNLLPFITRITFYTTGIFFSIEQRFADDPLVLRIASFVPLHEFLTLARGVLLDDPVFEAPPEFWLYASVWSIGVLVVGIVFFWAAEERYGRTD